MPWRVRLTPAAADALRSCHPDTRRELRAALRALAHDPTGREAGLDVKELTTTPPSLFRLRVRDWRVVFGLTARDILVARIFHRREGYGWLERWESGSRRGGTRQR